MIVREALAGAAARFERAGVDTPALDASLLLCAALGWDRAALFARDGEAVPEARAAFFETNCERRLAGESIAYILGRKEFWGLDFVVTRDVLVPRPDTETLVEEALGWANARGGELRVLDCCCGSGCVGIAVAYERPGLELVGSDISEAALMVASINGTRILGPDRAVFLRSDLLAAVPGRFDLILSNPPYVPTGDIATLAPEVRMEPRIALDGGPDGLELIGRLVGEAVDRLNAGGRLVVECASDETRAVAALFEAAGFGDVTIRKDLAGRERTVGGSVI